MQNKIKIDLSKYATADTTYKYDYCPFCGEELIVPIMHADGFGTCANYYKCKCGKVIENRYIVETDEHIIKEADEEVYKILSYRPKKK